MSHSTEARLLTRLASTGWQERLLAILELDRLTIISPNALVAVLAAINDPHAYVRSLAVCLYAKHVPDTSEGRQLILDRLGSTSDALELTLLIGCLADLPDRGMFAAKICHQLTRHEEADVRSAAMRALEIAHSQDSSTASLDSLVLSRTLECFEDDDWRVRENAVRLAGSVHPLAEETKQHLLIKCNDPNLRVRGQAFAVIKSLGPDGRSLIDDLLRLARELPKDSQFYAFQAISAIGLPDATYLPSFISALSGSSWSSVFNAMPAIADFGALARPYVPALRAACKSVGETESQDAPELVKNLAQDAVSRTIAEIEG
jgi:HEAT repeat protein